MSGGRCGLGRLKTLSEDVLLKRLSCLKTLSLLNALSEDALLKTLSLLKTPSEDALLKTLSWKASSPSSLKTLSEDALLKTLSCLKTLSEDALLKCLRKASSESVFSRGACSAPPHPGLGPGASQCWLPAFQTWMREARSWCPSPRTMPKLCIACRFIIAATLSLTCLENARSAIPLSSSARGSAKTHDARLRGSA